MIYRRKKHFTASRNRHHGFLRFLFWFTLAVFSGVVVYVLFFSSFLAVTSLKVSGNKYISEDAAREQIIPEIEGKFLGIVNKNNLLLVKKSNIRKNITEEFRQIRSVQVQKKFPDELAVRLHERVPTILFRGANEWFILDENAVAYDTTNPEAENIKKYDLPRLADLDGKSISLGEAVLSRECVDYVLGIKKKMKSDTEVQIENDFQTPSLISKDIRARAKEGWGIYFNENIALDKEIEMLNAVLKSEIEKSQWTHLDYIDLRIDNKVYYKFREGTPEETARLAAEEAAKNPAQMDSKESKDKKKEK